MTKVKITVIFFTIISIVCSMAGSAYAENGGPNYAEDFLTGDWGGERSRLYDQGYEFELNYKADFWRNFSGGVQQGNRVNDNLNLILWVDGSKAFNFNGPSAKIYFLNNNGGRINDLVGSNGGIDNIEVPEQSFKLFEAWLQQNFFDDRVSLLVGLHDLNSEFYATETAGLFLNPTYGIGTEMAATGDNGPSIFPYSSLGFRARFNPTDSTYVSGAVYDGVPGDSDHPRGTHISFNDGDGALLVAEGGVWDAEIGHFAVGGWKYTAQRPDQLTPADNAHSRGFYFLADRSLYSDEDEHDISAFGRLGYTGGDIEQFHSNWSLGFVLSGYVPSRPDGQIGFAVTQVANASKYKEANGPVEDKETQYELTYSDKIVPGLTLQPDLQYTVNPGTDPALDNAWTAGLRITIDF